MNMAQASLDSGSTRFRGEVQLGIRHLFDHKIVWSKDGHRAYVHGGCTLRTGRLLCLLAHLRLLDSAQNLSRLDFGTSGRQLETLAGGLLRFFLQRDPASECWWGIDCSGLAPGTENQSPSRQRGFHRGVPGIRSANYFAWAMRSLAMMLATHQRIRARDPKGRFREQGGGWLDRLGNGVSLEKVENLLARLWEVFCNPQGEDSEGNPPSLVDVLMDPRAEEPHSYGIGEVAITLLLLFDLHGWPATAEVSKSKRIRFEFGNDNLARLIGGLETAIERLEGPKLSQLSRYYLLPARVAVHRYHSALGHDLSEIPTGTPGKPVDPTRLLVEETLSCSRSTVWVTKGEDAGSWGYKTESTQRLVSSLTETWHYFLANPDVFGPVFEEVLAEKSPPSVS